MSRPRRRPGRISVLFVTATADQKLGARSISQAEAQQLAQNRHILVRNPHWRASVLRRFLLIGRTNGGRTLTLVIEATIDPNTWLIVTGWPSTKTERKILERKR
jgi:uncharacterized DUF497 family protein